MKRCNDIAFGKSVRGICVGIHEQKMFIYRNQRIFEYDENLNISRKSNKFPLPLIDGGYAGTRLICRLMRKGVISGKVGKDQICLWTRKSVLLVNVHSLELIRIDTFDSFKPPLNITYICGAKGGAFVFGEYSSNINKSAVNILEYSNDGINKIAEIPANNIEHIHSMLWDGFGTLIIFCGDFGDAASIWKLNIADMTLVCLFKGKQVFRGSTGFLDAQVLYYSTDTTSEVNKLLQLNLETGDIVPLFDMKASVIYGATLSDGMIFSTNLEASIDTKYSWNKWFTRELPVCFATSKVHVYRFIAKTGSLTEIGVINPSLLPYRLFQYPSFRVESNGRVIVLSGTSVQRLDGKVAIIRI